MYPLALCFSAAAPHSPCFFLEKYSTRVQRDHLLVVALFLENLLIEEENGRPSGACNGGQQRRVGHGRGKKH